MAIAQGGHSIGGSHPIDTEAPLHCDLVTPRRDISRPWCKRSGEPQLLAKSPNVHHGLGPEPGAQATVDETVD